MASSDYSFRPGGSLKLKGVAEGGITKKKKKQSKSKSSTEKPKATEVAEQDSLRADSPSSAPASGTDTVTALDRRDSKTEAETRFEETQRRRMDERVAKLSKMSHKDRVHELNQKLESLSEHHDIPKVGPG